jgi:hypothetical protein
VALGFHLRACKSLHLSHSPSPFALVNLDLRSRFLRRLAWTTVLLSCASGHGWDDRQELPRPAILLLRWGLGTAILPTSASCSWNDRHVSLSSYGLRWGLVSFCLGWPGTWSLPIFSASQVARVTGVGQVPGFTHYFCLILVSYSRGFQMASLEILGLVSLGY